MRGTVIITNNHVISGAKADQITVHLADNRLFHPSQVWADPESAIAAQSGSNSGVAFSIPVNMVKRVARQLVEKGSVTRGYLGVHLAQTMEPADALKLGLDRVQGALVETIYPESPAADAGLRGQD